MKVWGGLRSVRTEGRKRSSSRGTRVEWQSSQFPASSGKRAETVELGRIFD